jgi:hypothetical protein
MVNRARTNNCYLVAAPPVRLLHYPLPSIPSRQTVRCRSPKATAPDPAGAGRRMRMSHSPGEPGGLQSATRRSMRRRPEYRADTVGPNRERQSGAPKDHERPHLTRGRCEDLQLRRTRRLVTDRKPGPEGHRLCVTPPARSEERMVGGTTDLAPTPKSGPSDGAETATPVLLRRTAPENRVPHCKCSAAESTNGPVREKDTSNRRTRGAESTAPKNERPEEQIVRHPTLPSKRRGERDRQQPPGVHTPAKGMHPQGPALDGLRSASPPKRGGAKEPSTGPP